MTLKHPLSLDMFDYSLPESLIAQRPADTRIASRLLHLSRKGENIQHGTFPDLPVLLKEGDLLVLNDTKVFPARLLAKLDSGGAVEVFLLRFPFENDNIPCLVRPGRKIQAADRVFLDDGTALLINRTESGFAVRGEDIALADAVKRFGQVPLPPYIRRGIGGPDEADAERYQTVYADRTGAVAAPTAGLHFDKDILDQVRSRGIKVAMVTLHVGPGTFQPVRTRDITAHHMDEEHYDVPAETARLIHSTKERSGRVVAVGTTVVRTLESAYKGSMVRAGKGTSRLFIYPGYRFSVVDALLTNFHLPRSTLLMLVCAFGGTEFMLKAYREAVKEKYRFYSYGDAMFIE